MTRLDRIAEYLSTAAGPDGCPVPQMAAEILAIADDRTLVNLQGFADRIGRTNSTVAGWRNRGLHGLPEPAGVWSDRGWPYWDEDQVDAWITDHPGLVSKVGRTDHL